MMIFIVGFLLYLRILNAPFVFDDQIVIINNPLIQNLSQGWQGIVDVWNFQHSRFLTNLTLALNFHFHKLDTFGYHLVNVFIHLLTAWGVLVLTNLILKVKGEKKAVIDLGLWAALLFLVHPVNTEAVSYISQRSSSLVTLFYLWSVILYIQARISKGNARLYWIGACLAAGLAVLSKETAMTVGLAWMLVDYFVIGKKSPKAVWGICVAVVLVVIIFFDFNWKGMLTASTYSQSHHNDLLTPYTYLLTQIRVLVVLFNLIAIPWGLNLDYDFAMSHRFLELPVILSLLFLLVLLFTAYKIRRIYWAFSFVIIWFFISLLPHIYPPRANVIAEHKLYLTLSLLIPVLCYGLSKIMSQKVFIGIMLVIIAIFSFLTFQRNVLWSNPVGLWQDTVHKSPNKARAFINLGVAFTQIQKPELALASYQKAISLAPEMPQAYMNASEIFYRQGKLDTAMLMADGAVEVSPLEYLPYLQRGVLLARQARNKEAIDDINKVLQLNPQYREAYKMRGILYAALREHDKALEDFQQWLKWRPLDTDVLSQRADLYFSSKEYTQALADYNQLIQLKPTAGYYYNRSVIYQILGDTQKMSNDRRRALDLGFKLP